MNGVRHGLSGQTFFLLPDEDPAEFQEHEAVWLAAWGPRDLHEQAAAAAAIRAMWREIRADRLEAQVLGDLFAAGRIPDAAEAQAAKDKAFKALGGLLRYKARIEREYRAAFGTDAVSAQPLTLREIFMVLARARRAAATGDYAACLAHYAHVTSPTGDDAYDQACCHARLGHTDAAFERLGYALAHGFSDLAHARVDPDLEGLHADPRWPPTR